MRHSFKLADSTHEVALSRSRGGYRLHLGERRIEVNLARGPIGDALLQVDGRIVPVVIAIRGDDVFVHVDGLAYQLRCEHPLERFAHQASGAGASDSVRAPMPGNLIALHVAPGQHVVRGEALLVMESMKMQTTISAARDGVVGEVHFAVGQSFERDALLVEFKNVD